ncbi:phosphatidylinositol N-acetylglucosaminyltransferase subunit H isoform X5 [Saccopteryx bilineata]|uniref:phosphatidylinositol N-acetylglucosaminyltransferase subunit H isoform X5 n=1 Tax=Saccopteryx bilineata TaxID=59482 RepID=UPI00338F9EC5
MEEEMSFSDIYGGRLALQRRCYSPFCREFCLSCPRLSLRSLTAVTCTVWLVAYGLFALCENSMILSAAIFITLLGLLAYLHFVKIDQETLLIIDSLGIQMTSSYASGKESTTFIEMGDVKDIIINEAIYMLERGRQSDRLPHAPDRDPPGMPTRGRCSAHPGPRSVATRAHSSA